MTPGLVEFSFQAVIADNALRAMEPKPVIFFAYFNLVFVKKQHNYPDSCEFRRPHDPSADGLQAGYRTPKLDGPNGHFSLLSTDSTTLSRFLDKPVWDAL
ncbi:MAG: hypothetical protein KKG09_08650 [Verrucomicrobia bacterium]|nr:hypothetical protein [Verrucomicrobiota bacterium]MBU4247248.1 hypothetical protein [Verrucomicrobiota bacterium]MBU4289946.1 hypothetical protein [Verrucomicrobiota bacterium]MBU4498059.1 hypothetical protein [Verrucomicrobiota bacterium]MCG2679706.1 hypothetical protein [Kiritimatiellia bacterium]